MLYLLRKLKFEFPIFNDVCLHVWEKEIIDLKWYIYFIYKWQ